MEHKSSIVPLTFGFDIGIASVGWAVLATDRIVALGVRAFDKAETAKEGDSLNLVRRTARLMRHRLRRRALRLAKLARLLKRRGVIEDIRLFQPQYPYPHSLWKLRIAGLDRLLNNEEWARVIYHLCKHRGFHWVSRAEERKAAADIKGEGGKVKQGLAGTARLMQEKCYRSAAEMVLAEFPDAQRNKYGEYGKALARTLLGEELALLFKRQSELGNRHAGTGLEAEILGVGDRKSGLFWEQKPALAGNDLLKMLGKCTFEKTEYRAPKASFTAERHVWLTRLNNLRIVVDGGTHPMSEPARRLRSGDTENMEAQASAFYFRKLFSGSFDRTQEVWSNAALDHGYAIMRGAITRALVAHGFLPSIGLHHRSEQNAFNLADDLIEPFRPVVDLHVAKNLPAVGGESAELSPADKVGLVALLNVDMQMPRGSMTVLAAIEQATESFGRLYEGGSEGVLELREGATTPRAHVGGGGGL